MWELKKWEPKGRERVGFEEVGTEWMGKGGIQNSIIITIQQNIGN